MALVDGTICSKHEKADKLLSQALGCLSAAVKCEDKCDMDDHISDANNAISKAIDLIEKARNDGMRMEHGLEDKKLNISVLEEEADSLRDEIIELKKELERDK